MSDLVVQGLSLELRPSGSGSWRYRYVYDGKQECISFGLLADMDLPTARKHASNLQAVLLKGENPSKLNRDNCGICPTFSKFVTDCYLPHIRGYKRCVTADLTLLNNHLIPQFGHVRMNQITRQDVLAFQQEKVESGYKPAYCNRFLVLLGFCFNLAIKWEISGVEKNPVKLVSLLKANNKVERFLSKEESSRLFKAIRESPNPMLQYFVPLALLTGLRKRELLDSKWGDINFERKVWVIPRSKSGYSRFIPLTEETIALLQELKRQLPNLLVQESWLENPWVIPNYRTGKPFQSIFVSWDTARKKAGLHDLRIHDLRHSFASALVNKGVPIYDVQKLLGHQDVKTTERYAHLSMDRLRESASAGSKFYELDYVIEEVG